MLLNLHEARKMSKQCERTCATFKEQTDPGIIDEWLAMKRSWERDPSKPDPYKLIERRESCSLDCWRATRLNHDIYCSQLRVSTPQKEDLLKLRPLKQRWAVRYPVNYIPPHLSAWDLRSRTNSQLFIIINNDSPTEHDLGNKSPHTYAQTVNAQTYKRSRSNDAGMT